MTDVRQRIADLLREDIAPFFTGFCEGVEADVDQDALLDMVDELADDLASMLVSKLRLRPATDILDRRG